MKPTDKPKGDYEKVKCDDFISGVIEDVQYDKEHSFKGFQGQPDSKKEACRFIFRLDGYAFKHFSRWMTFNYAEKSNVYKKYLVPLVDHAEPFMDFDLDQLKGMKVKTLWKEENDFQSVETIRPIEGKIFRPLEKTIEEEHETEQSANPKDDLDLPF
jgi:hypothetical protein